MKRYAVSKKIDYIQCSVSRLTIPDDVFGTSEKITPMQRNYNDAIKYEIGAIVQRHTHNERMKMNILLSGTTLSNMRSVGMTDYDTLHWLKSMPNVRFSRIDIAVTSARNDGKIHDLPPHAINYLAANGMCKTKLKVDNPVSSPGLLVETAYIGSRKSRNRLFRAYDKGLELGKEANRIIRYELETRKNATHIANEIYEKRVDIAAIIRRYVDFPNMDAWLEIMDENVAQNYRIDDDRPQAVIDDEKRQNKMKWLLQSVAPAMASLALSLDDGFDNEFWDTFSRAVAYHYNNRLNK